MTSEKLRNDGLKRDKDVIYIYKECSPLAIIQYEQHILQRSIKLERKENKKYYMLRDNKSMDSSLFISHALTFATDRRRRRNCLQMAKRLFFFATL